MKGIEKSEEHKAKIGLANGTTIYLYDLHGSLVNTFCSARKAAEYLDSSHHTINMLKMVYCLKTNTIYLFLYLKNSSPITSLSTDIKEANNISASYYKDKRL
jgi:hypothetical protein